jgi:hypothetical protein
MRPYYVRFGRPHRLPSTVEILDELRSGYLPGYVRKSWAQDGFTPTSVGGEHAGTGQLETRPLPHVFPPLSAH